MKTKTKTKTFNIPMVIKVGNSCLMCPFFELESHGNSASGNCNAQDIDRACDLGITSYAGTELKITGKYSTKNIITVVRPKWCPLNVGDAIVTVQNE